MEASIPPPRPVPAASRPPRPAADRPSARPALLVGGVLGSAALLAWLGTASGALPGIAASPWRVAAALAAALALGALAGAWIARRERARTRRALAAAVAAGERLLGGDASARLAPAPSDPIAPLAGLLNRFADLRDATQSVLADRDRQLEALREMTGWLYWEQDAAGRYTRIEGRGPSHDALAEALVGRARWDSAGLPLGHGLDHAAAASAAGPATWDDHRRAFASGERVEELIWALPLAGSRRVFLCESGRARAGAGGEPQGWTGVMRDITADLERERIAQSTVTAMRVASEPTLLVESAPGWPGWKACRVNAAACALFARLESEVLSMDARVMFGDEGAELAGQIGEALREGRGMRRDAFVVDRYSRRMAVALRVDPIGSIGGMPGLAALSLDHFQAEASRLREQAEGARQALDAQRARIAELEVSARELRSFSSSVSHDLRAPLRVIDGFARLLKEDFGHTLDRVAHDHVNRILAAATRMNSMIDAMLRLARVSSEPVQTGPVDLSTLAREVNDEIALQYAERAVAVTIQPGMVANGDRVLLGVALQNLIGNAWKYTARTEGARIDVDAFERDGTTVYRVSDNGAGFDMRFADRLFRVFQRLHSATDFPGTGVGLATVARIVQRHHGRVWAESEPGRGARFLFTLGDGA